MSDIRDSLHTKPPTPRHIFSEFFKPAKIWECVIAVSFVWAIVISGYSLFTSIPYSSYSILLSALVLIVAILIQRKDPRLELLSGSQADAQKYALNSSRIGIISLIGGAVAIFTIPVVHAFEETSIEPTTRIVFVLILALILLASYVVSRLVLTIGTSLPIRLTTVLVLMILLVVVIPTILIAYTGFVYDAAAPYTIDVRFTLIDCLAVGFALYGLYFSLVTRL